MYPCVGSFGTFGTNSVPPTFGVYPGTYGITGTFGSVGSPGLVGSVGWFGYGIGVGVSTPGTFGIHDPNLV